MRRVLSRRAAAVCGSRLISSCSCSTLRYGVCRAVSIIRSSCLSLRLGRGRRSSAPRSWSAAPSWTVRSRGLSVLERWIVIPVTRRSSTVVTSKGKLPVRDQPVQRCGGAVAERRPRAGREQRPVRAIDRQHRPMPDRIHPPVLPDQPAALDAASRSAARLRPEREQLITVLIAAIRAATQPRSAGRAGSFTDPSGPKPRYGWRSAPSPPLSRCQTPSGPHHAPRTHPTSQTGTDWHEARVPGGQPERLARSRSAASGTRRAVDGAPGSSTGRAPA